MAAAVGSLYVALTADTQKFIGQFKTAERSVDHFGRRTEMVLNRNQAIMAATQRQLSAFGASFASAFKGGIVGAIGGIGISQIASSVRTVVAETAKLADVSAKLGVGTNELQELGFAANQSGVEITALHTSLEQFGKRIGEASRESGEFFEVLKANGVAIRDQAGNIRPLMELLSEYAELIRRAKSEQERLALANIAFGRSGGDMVLLLSQGAAGLDQFRRAAQDAGVVIRDDLVKTAADLDDKWEQFTASMTTRWRTFVLSVVNSLEEIRTQAQRLRSIQDAGQFGAETGRLIAAGPQGIATEELRAGLAAGGDRTPWQGRDAWLGAPVTLPQKESGGAARTREERDAVEELIAALRMEASLIGATDAERAVANNLRLAGANATAEQKVQIEALTRALIEGELRNRSMAEAANFFAETAYDGFRSLIPQIETGNDAIDRLTSSIIEAGLQAALLGKGPLANLFGGVGGGGGLFGIIGSVVTAAIGGIGGGLVSPSVPLYHSGGFAGSFSMTRHVSPLALIGAPRLHTGLGDREFAAILEKGERVQTAAMAQREAGVIAGLSHAVAGGMGGGGKPEIHIHEAPGTKADIEDRPDGGVDVFMRQVGNSIARDIFTNGPVSKAIERSFETRRKARK